MGCSLEVQLLPDVRVTRQEVDASDCSVCLSVGPTDRPTDRPAVCRDKRRVACYARPHISVFIGWPSFAVPTSQLEKRNGLVKRPPPLLRFAAMVTVNGKFAAFSAAATVAKRMDGDRPDSCQHFRWRPIWTIWR